MACWFRIFAQVLTAFTQYKCHGHEVYIPSNYYDKVNYIYTISQNRRNSPVCTCVHTHYESVMHTWTLTLHVEAHGDSIL